MDSWDTANLVLGCFCIVLSFLPTGYLISNNRYKRKLYLYSLLICVANIGMALGSLPEYLMDAVVEAGERRVLLLGGTLYYGAFTCLLFFFLQYFFEYVEIPSIDVSLPIYHGTSEEVLQVAVGHIEGASLPVGGESTHCVISGHRGLPSARLFTDLDQLSEGDIFTLRVLDETLTYEVDQIHVVEPDDITQLEIVEGEDLCTLVTCTPYGVNSHRLLVRGHRVENREDGVMRIIADAMQIDPRFVAPVIGAPILLAALLVMILRPLRRRKRKR